MRSFLASTPHKNFIRIPLESIRWAECVALMGEKAYKVFMEKSEGKRSRGISMHSW
jgi:hypothetical protein